MLEFNGRRGIAYNESVLASLRRINEDSDLLFDDPDVEGAVLISGIDRQDGGAPGRATEVLQAITSWADANGNKLALLPGMGSKYFLSKGQLEAWYERNGFVKRGSGLMVRKPLR